MKLTPGQQAVSRRLATTLNQRLANPQSLTREDLQPNINRSRLRIGKDAEAAKKKLRGDLTSRGFGESGLVGEGFADIERGRVGALGSLETEVFNALTEDKQRSESEAIQQALAFLPSSFGQVSTSRGGGVAAGANDALSALGTLYALSKYGGLGDD